MSLKPTILVVDDEQRNLIAMDELLVDLEADIVLLDNGPDALKFILQHPVSVILLDVQMPEMDGFEVAELIRRKRSTAHIPIIFLTAIAQNQSYAFKGYESGCVDFMFKPVRPEVLIAKLSVFLDLARSRMQLQQSYDELMALKATNEMIIESAGQAILSISAHGEVNLANQAAIDLFGCSGDENHLSDFIGNDNISAEIIKEAEVNQQFEGKMLTYNSAGNERVVQYQVSPLYLNNQRFSGMVMVARDVTDEHAKEAHLQMLVESDELTGLGNRRQFETMLKSAMSRYRNEQEGFVILFIDLDKFKQVNDQYGHEAGDKILIHVANCLKSAIRGNDIVCRFGGDEFAVLLFDTDSLYVASNVAERIIQDIGEPVLICGRTVNVRACIGISMCPDHSQERSHLLKLADTAMYQAKNNGGNQFVIAH